MPALKKLRHRIAIGVTVFVVFVSSVVTSLVEHPVAFAGSLAQNLPTVANAEGAIAYAKSDGLWLVNADGTNPRRIWQLLDPANQQITGLDWSPDGTRLAFASNHESTCSLYRSDIYSIRIDGTDLRRLTNSPACAGLSGFAKGSVQVTVENHLTESLFLLYVEGRTRGNRSCHPTSNDANDHD